MLHRKRIALAGLLAVAHLGCRVGMKAGYYAEENRAAVAALDVLHRRLNSGELQAIYEDTSKALHSQPKGTLMAAMQATRDRWGKLLNSEIKARSCFPNQVRFLVQAHFEKGDAGEIVVWDVPGDKALLQHFEISPGPMQPPAGAWNECKSVR
jgi:hypothetical protein